MPKIEKRDFTKLGTIHNRAKAETSIIDVEKRMIPFIIVSDDNAGLRYDWYQDEIYEERLDVNGATFESLNTFFKDHRMSVDTAIGKIENARIEDNQVKCNVIFGEDENSMTIFNKFRDGILTDVSIGYTIQEVTTTEREDEPTEVLVNKFDIHELSAVWKGFDDKAKVGRESTENLKKEVTPKDEQNIAKEKRAREIDILEISTKI